VHNYIPLRGNVGEKTCKTYWVLTNPGKKDTEVN